MTKEYAAMAIKYGRPIETRVRFVPVEAKAAAKAAPLDLTDPPAPQPPRRMGAAHGARERADHRRPDLAAVRRRRHDKRAPVASMPGVERLSVDEAVREAERAAKLGIPCIALFPYTDPKLRDEDGSEALNPDNLVCRAIRAIKKEVPEVGMLCDVALDPYTSHGHDGLLRDGVILNDETVAVLVQAGAGRRPRPAATSSRPPT